MISSEALFPPKPAESLRERLIREGTIVPSKNLDLLKQKIDKKLALFNIYKLNRFGTDLFIELYNSVVGCYKLSCVNGVSNLPANLYAFLLLKKIERIKRIILNDRVTEFILFNIYRCGFFFAFKENKKNTP
ncbi:MAG: hypothetical protein ACWA6Y_08960 [Polaromonas sp.]